MKRPTGLVPALAVLLSWVVVLGSLSLARRSRGPAAVSAAGPPGSAPAAGRGRALFFVGLDGADWQLLDPYMARGLMPNLTRLVKEGAGGALRTETPALSPLVWTTMMTGVSPLEHRILDFTRFNPATGEREPITSDERAVPAVWNMANSLGVEAAVLGLWATFPAEPVRSLVVSDRLIGLQGAGAGDPRDVYPPAAAERSRQVKREVEAAIGLSDLRAYLPDLGEAEFREASAAAHPYAQPVSALLRILIDTRLIHRLAGDAWRIEAPRLLIAYHEGTDTIGHVFAPFAPPRQASVSAADFARYGLVAQRYFQEIDRMLGDYAAWAGRSSAVLMLASDHGFRWGDGRPEELSSQAGPTAARWHREDGIYLLWGSGIAARPGHREHGGVRQTCATILSLLGLPPGKGLAGPPLPGAPWAASIAPVDYRAQVQAPRGASPAPARADSSAGEALAKLRALGYLGHEESSSRGGGPGREATRTAASFNNEGLLLRSAGGMTAAATAFERALALDPHYASAEWNLSDLLFAERGHLDRNLERDPERATDLLLAAGRDGLPEASRRVLDRVVALRRLGEERRGVQLLDRAVSLLPDRADLWLYRGRTRLEGESCQGALADLERSAGLAPAVPLVHAGLGFAHLCLGNRPAARRELEQALALDPHQDEVRRALEELR